MSQKSKSSGKPKKAAKPASPKTKAAIKPKTVREAKAVETNHKASSKTSTKAVKAKTISNGVDEDHEATRVRFAYPGTPKPSLSSTARSAACSTCAIISSIKCRA